MHAYLSDRSELIDSLIKQDGFLPSLKNVLFNWKNKEELHSMATALAQQLIYAEYINKSQKVKENAEKVKAHHRIHTLFDQGQHEQNDLSVVRKFLIEKNVMVPVLDCLLDLNFKNDERKLSPYCNLLSSLLLTENNAYCINKRRDLVSWGLKVINDAVTEVKDNSCLMDKRRKVTLSRISTLLTLFNKLFYSFGSKEMKENFFRLKGNADEQRQQLNKIVTKDHWKDLLDLAQNQKCIRVISDDEISPENENASLSALMFLWNIQEGAELRARNSKFGRIKDFEEKNLIFDASTILQNKTFYANRIDRLVDLLQDVNEANLTVLYDKAIALVEISKDKKDMINKLIEEEKKQINKRDEAMCIAKREDVQNMRLMYFGKK